MNGAAESRASPASGSGSFAAPSLSVAPFPDLTSAAVRSVAKPAYRGSRGVIAGASAAWHFSLAAAH
jgi:hypothetical protein